MVSKIFNEVRAVDSSIVDLSTADSEVRDGSVDYLLAHTIRDSLR